MLAKSMINIITGVKYDPLLALALAAMYRVNVFNGVNLGTW